MALTPDEEAELKKLQAQRDAEQNAVPEKTVEQNAAPEEHGRMYELRRALEYAKHVDGSGSSFFRYTTGMPDLGLDTVINKTINTIPFQYSLNDIAVAGNEAAKDSIVNTVTFINKHFGTGMFDNADPDSGGPAPGNVPPGPKRSGKSQIA